MRRSILTLVLGLSAMLYPQPTFAQTANEIFSRAKERLAQDEKNQASWNAEARDAADKEFDNLKAKRCIDGENEIACQAVVLCSSAPEIAGEHFAR
jgi:hypothetical protein